MRNWLWLWGPVAVAVLVRLALWLGGGLWTQTGDDLLLDTVEYHVLGESLSEGRRFAYRHPTYTPPYSVEALRTPGYPVFVASVYALVGERPGWVLFLQILLDGATCLILARTLRERLGTRGAGVAALVFALHPAASLYTVILLSESLFVFLLVAVFSLLWAPRRAQAGDFTDETGGNHPGVHRASAAGTLLGLAVLVKPLALWAVPVVALVVGWTHRPLARSLRPSLALVALAALVVAPWAVRNATVWGTPMISTSGAYNALALYAAPVQARAMGTTQGEATRALFYQADLRARDAGLRPSEIDDVARAPFWRAEAADVILRHPLTVVELEARGLVRSFVSIGRVSRRHVFGEREGTGREPGASGALQWWAAEPLRDKALDLWALAYALAVYPLIAVGVLRAVRQRTGGIMLAAGVLAAFLLLTTAIPGYSRFLVPAVPFLAVFAGRAASRRETSPVERA